MFKRPEPKKLTHEQMQKIVSASAKQEPGMSSPKTYNPDYPVFDTPVNQKVLIYIPNHSEIDEKGAVQIRADRYCSHTVRVGKAFTDVRCCGDLVNEELHWNGSCPVCDATNACWDLYKYQISDIARSKGVSPENAGTDELLAEDRKRLLSDMVVRAREKWITFPIIVIECEEGKTVPKKGADGKINGTPMFYSIRELTYQDKWKKAFDALEDDGADENPAGRWAVLNFTYTPKTGQHTKRDSARNLSVSFRRMEGYGEWEKYFDKLTEGWDAECAINNLVRNSVRSMEEMEEVAAQLLEPVNTKLAEYRIMKGEANVPQVVTSSAEDALANFGGAEAGVESPMNPPTSPKVNLGEMPFAQ